MATPTPSKRENSLFYMCDGGSCEFTVLDSILKTCGRVSNPPDSSDPYYRFSDVTFHVGEESFYASKAILAPQVPYFNRMFDGGMRESRLSEIELKDVEPDVFWIVLQFICSGKLQEETLTFQMGCKVFKYADMIQLPTLTKYLYISNDY